MTSCYSVDLHLKTKDVNVVVKSALSLNHFFNAMGIIMASQV